MVFIFQFVNVVYYIDWFADIKESLHSWLIHVNVWQKPLQYCKVISLQLIKINEKKKDNTINEKWMKGA